MKHRDDLVYVEHMIDSIESVYKFIGNKSFEEFKEDDLVISGVIRKLEILGEASGKVSDSIKLRYPNIEWRILKDFRNYLIHQYFGVDVATVWEAIQTDMPILKEKLLELKRILIQEKNN
ncbi:MAG: HepT-like ribonuclease domain-containing protein [Cetobacterium sp.]|uniref:HepT-like ribonuclease domain-containing protein n=1 Tax=Cetobacterium sp. TaxID=2071632 RepID=UPI003F38A539